MKANYSTVTKILRVVAVCLLASALSQAEAADGRVIDQDGKPLAGVWVFVEWTGSSLFGLLSPHSSTGCDMVVARTDSKGEYRARKWLLGLREIGSITLYLPGYRRISGPKLYEEDRVPSVMGSDERPAVERLREMARLADRLDCGGYIDQHKDESAALMRTMTAEADSLARSKTERLTVVAIRDWLYRIEVGREEGTRRVRSEIDAIRAAPD